MTNKKISVFIGSDDIYFIIGNRQTSILKMLTNLDKKINRFSIGAWAVLGLSIISIVPATLVGLALTEIKEQNVEIKEQEVIIRSLSDRLLILETQLKDK